MLVGGTQLARDKGRAGAAQGTGLGQRVRVTRVQTAPFVGVYLPGATGAHRALDAFPCRPFAGPLA